MSMIFGSHVEHVTQCVHASNVLNCFLLSNWDILWCWKPLFWLVFGAWKFFSTLGTFSSKLERELTSYNFVESCFLEIMLAKHTIRQTRALLFSFVRWKSQCHMLVHYLIVFPRMEYHHLHGSSVQFYSFSVHFFPFFLARISDASTRNYKTSKQKLHRMCPSLITWRILLMAQKRKQWKPVMGRHSWNAC